MMRLEGGLVLVLLLITILTLSFLPPEALSASHSELALASPTALAVQASPTVDPTASWTPRPSRTPTATLTPTATASPTSTPTLTATHTPTATASPTATPFPFDTRADLARFIYVDQEVQYMYIFERGQLLRALPCSTGLPDPSMYTPAWSGPVGYYVGTFFAFDVFADEAWYLFMHDGMMLVHSLPYTLQNGYKVYQDGDALGVRPASHGCIRLDPDDAKWFSDWRPEGVLMTISDPYLDKWR